MNAYKVGASVRCSAVFTNDLGAAVDPSTVTFRLRTPAGTVTSYAYGTDAQLVKDATGNYHVDLSASQAGRWTYRFEGTGAAPSADEAQFAVESSRIL